MKELQDIVQSFEQAEKQHQNTALLTVVHVEGSSYRRPGARMLVDEKGNLTGAISGGCLEGDALRKALHVITRQRSMLVTYDTTDGEDNVLGVGLGCHGIIQVLIEPIDSLNQNNPVRLLKTLLSQRSPAVVITLFSLEHKNEPQIGTCLLLKQGKMIKSTIVPALLEKHLVNDAGMAFADQASFFKKYVNEKMVQTAFIEFVKPAISLVIIGAGNDVKPLADMAFIMGWNTTIIDGRANYAAHHRFPKVQNILVSKPENVLQKLRIDNRTAFVLMTHNYNYDYAMLRQLVQQNAVYIGMLGPKKKLDSMLYELKQEGLFFDTDKLSAIYAPVGLDLGAESSEEIALSIMAEIKGVMSNAPLNPLRENTTPIHPRSETVIQEETVI